MKDAKRTAAQAKPFRNSAVTVPSHAANHDKNGGMGTTNSSPTAEWTLAARLLHENRRKRSYDQYITDSNIVQEDESPRATTNPVRTLGVWSTTEDHPSAKPLGGSDLKSGLQPQEPLVSTDAVRRQLNTTVSKALWACIREFEDRHAYLAQVEFAKADKARSQKLDAESAKASKQIRKSPFQRLKPAKSSSKLTVRLSANTKTDGNRSANNFTAPTTVKSTVEAVRPYVNYTRLSRNLLVPNDREFSRHDIDLKLLVEEDQTEFQKEIRAKFSPAINQQKLMLRETARQLGPPVLRCMSSLNIKAEEILPYLLTPEKDGVESEPTHIFSENANNVRALFRILKTIFHESLESLALFGGLDDLSDSESQVSLASLMPSDYLVCDLCHRYNCNLHGQFTEDKKSNVDKLSEIQRRASNSTNSTMYEAREKFLQHNHNHRWRVNASYGADEDEAMPWLATVLSGTLDVLKSKDAVSSHNFKDFKGIDDNNTIAGEPHVGKTLVGIPELFGDFQLCANGCFWKKSNRLGNDAVVKDLSMFYNTYAWTRYSGFERGPCLIADRLKQAGLDIGCREVFHYMIVARTKPAEPHTTHKALMKRPPDYWEQFSKAGNAYERKPFYPCFHPGRVCAEAYCRCAREEILCEKQCRCAASCTRKFTGCSCDRQNLPCYVLQDCECRQLNRECDPDLCGGCGAREILDPLNRGDDSIREGRCRNVNLTYGQPARTLLAHSSLKGVDGFGLFAGENLKKHTFVGEYTGELVSKSESERRDVYLQREDNQYTMKLNAEQVLEGARGSNKTRYINSREPEQCNCVANFFICNTEVRIGIFTNRSVKAGQELFFNYGESFWENVEGSPKRITAGNSPLKKKRNGSSPAKDNESDDSDVKVAKRKPSRRIIPDPGEIGDSDYQESEY